MSVKALEEAIEKLKNEKSSLGLFKGGEKKAIQEKIDVKEQEMKAAAEKKTAYDKPLNEGITEKEKRVSEIEAKLENPLG